jgi:protein-L-isoaspartate O-methyltransferase
VNGIPDLAARIDRLADALASQGYLTGQKWREALHAVPRHLFVPDSGWALPDFDGKEPYPINRARDKDAWLNAAYSDTSIVTQIDDGATEPETGDGLFSSSISAPGVVCGFLELLDVRRGNRVLEIGTGTGWTAALLASCVGAENVVTVEVDPRVSEQARTNLTRAGTSVTAITGDGAEGVKPWAPYDRVHVACDISQIPYSWIEQTRNGGIIVAPYQPGYGYGHKLRLDVLGDGTAIGRFHGPAGYMMMRSHRPKHGQLSSFLHHEEDADISVTSMDPRTVTELSHGGELAISAMVPGVRFQVGQADDDSGEETLWLLETAPDADVSGSWALAEYASKQREYEVTQYGTRRLWDEVSEAYLKWVSWGRPERERFGMTITPDQQRIWLDLPFHII